MFAVDKKSSHRRWCELFLWADNRTFLSKEDVIDKATNDIDIIDELEDKGHGNTTGDKQNIG